MTLNKKILASLGLVLAVSAAFAGDKTMSCPVSKGKVTCAKSAAKAVKASAKLAKVKASAKAKADSCCGMPCCKPGSTCCPASNKA